jgi:excisionase family DNA binding protein
MASESALPGADAGFVERIHRDVRATAHQLGSSATVDIHFLCYLRQVARFGYFTLGPITIDVRLIEDIVERTSPPGNSVALAEDNVRFSRVLMQEMRRGGRKRIDELTYLLAFMRCKEGLPGRVFGELGVTPEQIETYLRETGGAAAEPAERLMTPEEVAEYLRVHVQTVRAWIRAGTLPARRVAGLRALRVRFADVSHLLQPVDGPDAAGN